MPSMPPPYQLTCATNTRCWSNLDRARAHGAAYRAQDKCTFFFFSVCLCLLFVLAGFQGCLLALWVGWFVGSFAIDIYLVVAVVAVVAFLLLLLLLL